MRVVLASVLGVLLLASAAGAGATVTSGVRGRMLQPLGGTCPEGLPCERPVEDAVISFTRPGHAPARTTTRDGGWYRLRLAPGRYRASVSGEGRARLVPAGVDVPRGRFIRVDFRLIDVSVP